MDLGTSSSEGTARPGLHGDQSGERIERNRAQLRTTRSRSRRLNPRARNQILPAGAGRSQVQILSPRSRERPANAGLSASRCEAADGATGTNGEIFCSRGSVFGRGRSTASNPVARAARPRRRREGDSDPDPQFLTLPELEAVIAVIPDGTVDRDALGPVLRLVVLAAATSGLRQSERLGLRWKHVDTRRRRARCRRSTTRLGFPNGRPGRVGTQLSASRSQAGADSCARILIPPRIGPAGARPCEPRPVAVRSQRRPTPACPRRRVPWRASRSRRSPRPC
jgi:integrase